MANKKSAEKRISQTATKNERNCAIRSACRTSEKSLRAKVQANDKAAAMAAFKMAESKFASAVSKGIYHQNTVSRKISRLAKLLQSI
jgi:small subunit ribosomal protein S20